MNTRRTTCVLLLAGMTLLSLVGCGGSNSMSATHNPPPAVHDEWTWVSGSDSVNQLGIYGTKGTATVGDTPGGRVHAVAWIDASGNFWLFGGFGISSTYMDRDLNDLWEYSGGKWTWVSGSNLNNQPGIYGTKGTASVNNVPGARQNLVSWVDTSGDFWLFGGLGIDSTGTGGELNDLWKYDPTTKTWTWKSGSNLVNQYGVYGTEGVAAPNNVPGARFGANSWVDASGNLWLFGGFGWDPTGIVGLLNDLWRYSPTTNTWTWMSGSNIANQYGVYGTEGMAESNNVPGARSGAVAWTDAAGNFWLFGGDGGDANGARCRETGSPCLLNDLWKYSVGEWTWMGGSNLNNEPGAYGTQGIAAHGNIPPPRSDALGWTDATGNFWLFGGIGPYDFNDLWKYSNGEWTWMGGSRSQCPTGSYGTQGTTAPSNVPGGRNDAVGWTDKSGNLWLFGGGDSFCNGSGTYNDLWEYQP